MRKLILRFLCLIFGAFLYALGIVITIKANIGYAPWEVFHVGLSVTTGISLGAASIIVGIFIVVFVTVCGETLGFGTFVNIIFIGVFIDLTMALNIIPLAPNIIIGVIALIAGLFLISVGSYFYMKSAFGAGPRDNLMVVLNRKTKLPVGLCRSFVELTVTVAGWFLGGMVGIGTVISVIAIGFCIQITFAVFRFDVTAVKHETLKETFKTIKSAFSSR